MIAEKPSQEDMVAAARAVYDFSGVGGGLHIVLDDGNVESSHLLWCLGWILENTDDPAQRHAELHCLAVWGRASLTQRNKVASARYGEYYEGNP